MKNDRCFTLPENRPLEKDSELGNHHFWGAMLASRGVIYMGPKKCGGIKQAASVGVNCEGFPKNVAALLGGFSPNHASV